MLFAVNQRNAKYQEYALASYKRLKECGLTGLFHDSHFNLATDTINFLHETKPVHWSPAQPDPFKTPIDLKATDHIVSMHDTALRLQQKIQVGIGMVYYVESEGALGTPMCGTDYEHTRGNEYIYSNMETGLDTDKIGAFGDDPTTAYFRAMAARLMYAPEINPDTFPDPSRSRPGGMPKRWHRSTMPSIAWRPISMRCGCSRTNAESCGREGGKVLFAYKDFTFPLESPSTVYDARSDKRALPKTT